MCMSCLQFQGICGPLRSRNGPQVKYLGKQRSLMALLVLESAISGLAQPGSLPAHIATKGPWGHASFGALSQQLFLGLLYMARGGMRTIGGGGVPGDFLRNLGGLSNFAFPPSPSRHPTGELGTKPPAKWTSVEEGEGLWRWKWQGLRGRCQVTSE